jgi:hypothetical protein
MQYFTAGRPQLTQIYIQGVTYDRELYCNSRFSELDRYIKVSFGYDVPIQGQLEYYLL